MFKQVLKRMPADDSEEPEYEFIRLTGEELKLALVNECSRRESEITEEVENSSISTKKLTSIESSRWWRNNRSITNWR